MSPEDGEDGGSAGVREPRRPSPIAPSAQEQRIAISKNEG